MIVQCVLVVVARLAMKLAHVVRVGDTVEDVEALVGRQQAVAVSKVPLAETTGRVAVFGEHVRDRHLIGVKTVVVRRKDHVLVHRDALRVAPGQERGA